MNVQGSSGSILSLYNADTTTYAANTTTAIEFKLLTGNTGTTSASCEIRAFKENGTNGNSARALSFYTGENGGSPTERLRITSTGAVGINTTVDAATKLQVQTDTTSTTAGGNVVARFQSNGSGRDATIQLSDNVAHSATISMLSSALVFKQSGTETFRIDSDGQIGIGNITPDTWSTGHGLTIGTSQATLWGVGDQVNLSGNAYFNSGWKAAATKAGASQIQQALGNIDFRVTGSINADAAITWTEAVRITPAGVIGINDTNPGTGKKVKVVVANNSSYQMAVNLTNNVNADINFYIKTNESLIAPSTNTPLCLGTGGAEKVRITSDGKVGIGDDDPDYMLQLKGTIPAIALEDTSGTHGFSVIEQNDDNLKIRCCLLYTSPSPRDQRGSRMPSSA